MPLEHADMTVYGLRQTNLMRQLMQGPDPTTGNGTVTVGKFITDVTGPQHGLRPIFPRSAGQAISDAALSAGQFLMGTSFHLKRLLIDKAYWHLYYYIITPSQAFRFIFHKNKLEGEKSRWFKD
jgi:hypothetical protein